MPRVLTAVLEINCNAMAPAIAGKTTSAPFCGNQGGFNACQKYLPGAMHLLEPSDLIMSLMALLKLLSASFVKAVIISMANAIVWVN